MSWRELVDIVTIVGNLAVVGGLWFGIQQLKDYRRGSENTASMELTRIWNQPDFGKHMRLILGLPEGISGEELNKQGEQKIEAALVVAMTMETVGLMVHQDILRLDTAWKLIGGMTLESWGRLEGWITLWRVEQENAKFAEWFQWLVIHFKQIKKTNSFPAYENI